MMIMYIFICTRIYLQFWNLKNSVSSTQFYFTICFMDNLTIVKSEELYNIALLILIFFEFLNNFMNPKNYLFDWKDLEDQKKIVEAFDEFRITCTYLSNNR